MSEQKSVVELRGEAKAGSGQLDGRYYLMEQEVDCLQSLFCCFCEGAKEFSIA